MPKRKGVNERARLWKIAKLRSEVSGVKLPMKYRSSTIASLNKFINEDARPIYVHSIKNIKIKIIINNKIKYTTIRNATYADRDTQLNVNRLKSVVLSDRYFDLKYDWEEITQELDSYGEHFAIETNQNSAELQRLRNEKAVFYGIAAHDNTIVYTAPEHAIVVETLQWSNTTTPAPVADETCGFAILFACAGLSNDHITLLTGRTKREGLTINDIIRVCQHEAIPCYVVNASLDICMQTIIIQDESANTEIRANRGKALFLMAHNSHFSILNENDRAIVQAKLGVCNNNKRVFNDECIQPEKENADNNEYIYAESMEDAAQIADNINAAEQHSPEAIMRDIEIIKQSCADKIKSNESLTYRERRDANKKVKAIAKLQIANLEKELRAAKLSRRNAKAVKRTNIYVADEDLMPLLADQIKSGIVNKIKMDGGNVVCIEDNRGTRVHASPDFKTTIEIAKLAGITYKNQSVESLTKMVFEKMNGDKWTQSRLNNEMFDALTMRKYNGLLFANKIDVPINNIRAVDIKRAYRYEASQGGFYTLSFRDTPTTQKIEGQTPVMYYVETADPYVFGGNGFFDYKVVHDAITMGVINNDNIKGYIYGSLSPANDKSIVSFINAVDEKYANVSKFMINALVGLLGMYKKKTTSKSVVIATPDDIKYYVARDTNIVYVKDRDDKQLVTTTGNPIMICTEHSVEDRHDTDMPVRLAIVQRSRLRAYTYMRQISMMYKVISVWIDSITYAVNDESQPGYPVKDVPEYGDLRHEPVKLRGSIIEPAVFNGTFTICNDWANVTTADENADFNAYDILKYKRAFVQGNAGTGKSHIARELKKICEDMGLRVAMSAFTHVAANILDDGKTLHSLFKIGSKQKHKLHEFDVYIIDEVSMCGDNILAAISQIPDDKRVYFFGDQKQLPPVNEKPVCDMPVFKAMCGYNMFILKKQYRANKEYANQCVNYYDAAKSGDPNARLPDGVKVVEQYNPDNLDVNTEYLVYTNNRRINVNNAMCKLLNVPESLPSDRVVVGYDRRAGDGCKYMTEIFDKDAAISIIKNADKYDTIASSRSFSPAECINMLAKYVWGSRLNERPVCYYNNDDNAIGFMTRWIPKNSCSLAMIARPIRHAIAGQLYHDIDIVNCHPQILYQYANRQGCSVEYMRLYIEQRDKILKLMINESADKDKCKKIILSMINGGLYDYENYINMPNANEFAVSFLRGLMVEINAIHDKFIENYANAYVKHIEIRRASNAYKQTDRGSFVNKMLIDSERKIMEIALVHFAKAGFMGPAKNRGVLCADGIMLEKGLYNETDIMRVAADVEADVQRQLNYNIKFTIKQMNQPVTIYPCADTRTWKPTNNNQIDHVIADEFTHQPVINMPLISNVTNSLVFNNEFVKIIETLDEGYNVRYKGADMPPASLTDSDKRRLRRDALKIVRADMGNINKSRKKEFLQRVDEIMEGLIERDVAALVKDGLYYKLECENGDHIVVDDETLRKSFTYRYAMTVHKSQGRTFTDNVCVMQFSKLPAEGQYVAITRVTDPTRLTVVVEPMCAGL